MSNIFISYNRNSEAIVKTLADDIEALGHNPWFDQELSGGQAWWEQILKQIRDCDVFILILSPESLDSVACKREYGYAVDLGKPTLPILVADGVSTNLLPPELSKIQFVDYRQQDRKAAFRLAKSIAIVPPTPALPDPLPHPPEVPISYLGGLTALVETASLLDYEKQSALVMDLKRSLRNQETSQDARVLLGKLRKRHDLLASIAEEIEELLVAPKKTSQVFSVSENTNSLEGNFSSIFPYSENKPASYYSWLLNYLFDIDKETSNFLYNKKPFPVLLYIFLIVYSVWCFFDFGNAVNGGVINSGRAGLAIVSIGLFVFCILLLSLFTCLGKTPFKTTGICVLAATGPLYFTRAFDSNYVIFSGYEEILVLWEFAW
ncbi:MAG: toll/interleukin-1 receptor domain-containing protein [Candidatus Methylumidiphilus sp.]